jgi:uncharacterized phage protein gp47/JayE
MARSIQTIIDSMISSLRKRNGDVDVKSGQLVRDIVIEVPAEQMSDLYSGLDTVAQAQSISTASSTDLDNLASNLGVARKQGTRARGSVTFSTSVRPTVDIIIPAGAVVGTVTTSTSGTISFQITTTTIMYASLADTYFDPTDGLYKISAPIEALFVGAAGNVGAGTINQINTPIQGITQVTNPDATAGGTDLESDTDFAARIPLEFTGNDLGTKDGYKKIVLRQENIEDALVITGGDPLMQRDLGLGGKIDIYLLESSSPTEVTHEQYTFHTAENPVALTHQPVTDRITQPIVQVTKLTLGGEVVIDPTNYVLVRDTSLVAGSARAQDKINFLPGAGLIDGDTIYITYNYDKIVQDIQTLLEEDIYHLPTADVLSRRSTRVLINITASIKIVTGGVFDDGAGGGVKNAVITTLTNFINGLLLGEDIDYSKVISLILGTSGVVDVQIPLSLLAKEGGSGAGSIAIEKNEFARAGVITINQWI